MVNIYLRNIDKTSNSDESHTAKSHRFSTYMKKSLVTGGTIVAVSGALIVSVAGMGTAQAVTTSAQSIQSQINSINSQLDTLENEASTSSSDAVEKNLAYSKAQNKVNESQQKLNKLKQEINSVQKQEKQSAGSMKEIAVTRYKEGASRGKPGLPDVKNIENTALENNIVNNQQEKLQKYEKLKNQQKKAVTDQRKTEKSLIKEKDKVGTQANEAMTAQKAATAHVIVAQNKKQHLMKQLANLKNTSTQKVTKEREDQKLQTSYQEQYEETKNIAGNEDPGIDTATIAKEYEAQKSQEAGPATDSTEEIKQKEKGVEGQAESIKKEVSSPSASQQALESSVAATPSLSPSHTTSQGPSVKASEAQDTAPSSAPEQTEASVSASEDVEFIAEDSEKKETNDKSKVVDASAPQADTSDAKTEAAETKKTKTKEVAPEQTEEVKSSEQVEEKTDEPTSPPAVVTGDDYKGYATQAAQADYGWGTEEFACLDQLWERESNWNPSAVNESSGAYGIAQALPGEKMAAAGLDWQTNAQTQINWGLGYIKERYGTPCTAWAHSELVGWY